MSYGNRTFSEYESILAKVNNMVGAELSESKDRLIFSAAGISSYKVTLELTSVNDRFKLVPQVRCGSLTTSADPLSALAQMDEARNLIIRAQQALLMLANHGVYCVYFRDCPCDHCSGSGKGSRGENCKRCDGKGVRND